MSNLLKSKFLFGVMIVAVVLVGFAAFHNTAAAASCTITTTLKAGSTGAGVMCLQTALGLTSDGHFGPKTKAAVMAWQTSKGLVADGIFGAKSRAVFNTGGVAGNYPAGCTSNTGYSSTTGMPCSGGTNLPTGCTSAVGYSPTTGLPCSGTGVPAANPTAAGNISTDGILGGFASTVVGTGDVNHNVAGFQLTGAGGGSDLNLSYATVQLLENPAAAPLTGSSRLSDYFSAVSLYEGDTIIGTVPASAFSSNSVSGINNYVYSASVPLTGAVVHAGQVNNFYVAVTANTSMDSGNFGNNKWGLQVSNIRFTDGTGMTLVYNPTNSFSTTWNLDPFFSFGSTASANNIILNVSRSSSDQNSQAVTVTTNSGATFKVPLLQMTFASQGGQAISINKFPVTFTPAGAGNNKVINQTGEVYLMQGNTVLDSEAIPSAGACATNTTACTISFKINPSTPLIVSGSPIALTVAADINSVTGGAYTEGDSLLVSTPIGSAAWDLTSGTPNGTELMVAGSYTTIVPGTANGQAVAFYATGINVNVASNTCSAAQAGYGGGHSVMTCTVNFSVTANGAPMYIPQASGTSAANANTVNFVAANTSGPVVTGAPAGMTVTATYVQNGQNASNGTNQWIIPAGVTANFTGTVVLDDTASGNGALYRGYLNDVMYGTATGVWGVDYVFNLGATNPAVPGFSQLN